MLALCGGRESGNRNMLFMESKAGMNSMLLSNCKDNNEEIKTVFNYEYREY